MQGLVDDLLCTCSHFELRIAPIFSTFDHRQQFRVLFLLAGKHFIGNNNAQQHTYGPDQKVYAGEIKGRFIRSEIRKSAIHDQWPDNGGKAHEAGQRALQLPCWLAGTCPEITDCSEGPQIPPRQ